MNVFAKFMKETAETKLSETYEMPKFFDELPESQEDTDKPILTFDQADELSTEDRINEYLEKGEDGKYYDIETGKAYDSVEIWEKSQETLAKRYEGTSDFHEGRAAKEYARYKNAENNGESLEEKKNHYANSQKFYEQAKSYREGAEQIRSKLATLHEDKN